MNNKISSQIIADTCVLIIAGVKLNYRDQIKIEAKIVVVDGPFS